MPEGERARAIENSTQAQGGSAPKRPPSIYKAVGAACLAVLVARLGEHVTPGAIGFGAAILASVSHRALLRALFIALCVLIGASVCLEALWSNVKPLSPADGGVALVTGASGGIGANIATELAKRGWNLVLVSRKKPLLDDLAKQLYAAHGVNATVLVEDLAYEAAVPRIGRALEARGLQVDVLINNAGISQRGTFIDMEPKRIRAITALNVEGTTALTRLLAPGMAERGRGRILFVSSLYGLPPGGPTTAVYAASKAYLLSLARSLRGELAPYGVGVTALAPGATTDTGFAAEMGAEGMLIHKLPLGLHLPARDVAKEAVEALFEGRGVICPGWTNRLVYAGIIDGFLPKPLASAIAALVIVPVEELLAVKQRLPFSGSGGGGGDTAGAGAATAAEAGG